MTAAHLKLMAALPADLRDRSGRIADRFHLDTPAWYDDADRTPHLTEVADAVWHDRTVRMRYLRWAEPHETSRTVQPYGLVLKAGHWYLVAGAGERIRTYRISRIVDLHVLDERFTRPAGFDLAGHWETYLESFDARRHSGEAAVKLSPRAFDRLPHLVEPVVARAARRTARAPDERGWIQVRVPIESVDQALPEFLKLGADAEVLAPVELRDRLTATLGELTRLYGAG
ncbi:helix-turn-helix transcriptional regulator [Saccharopolyspora indica]